ncbi:MAG: hypothetical protein JXB26_06840 [Candidatus Aminicenantes bacterium]|nr:hypothetical protein [Candidatus Aminicenantes bacterium]
MNIKVKFILLILLIFILGIFTGGMLNRALLQHRIRKAFSLRYPAPFITNFERIINPTPEQRQKIRKILEKHTRNIYNLRIEFQNSTKQELDNLRKELEPLLTEEQKARLEESHLNRLRRPGPMPPFRTPPWRGPWKPPRKDPNKRH